MKALALILLALAAAAPVAAAQPTGLAGTVVDLDNGKPLRGAQVEIYHLPLQTVVNPIATLVANDRGFFADISLTPGRYLVVANANGVRTACEISKLYHGVVGRLRMEISSKGERCIGKHVSSALVVPGQTADVYVVH